MVLTGIKNRTLYGVTEPIKLSGCSNITIERCNILNFKDRGVYLYKCTNIMVVASSFANVITGVLADHCGDGIMVNGCMFKNMMGAMPSGQAVQFNTTNGRNSLVCNNTIFNYPSVGNPEDAINMYKSNGMPESPILIANNRIRGGGANSSGGGIMLGDNGGSWQIAYNNTLVDPGQYGVAISGGDKNSLIDNLVYARQQAFTNVGLYVNDYSPIGSFISKGNRINYTNKDGIKNNSWFGFGTPTGVENDDTLSDSLIPW